MSKPFIRLEREFVRTETWRALSPGAVKLLIDMWAGYNGRNNGAIRYSQSRAIKSLRCSYSTAVRLFKELEAAGLIRATERGGFRYKTGARQGHATAWRIIPPYPI